MSLILQCLAYFLIIFLITFMFYCSFKLVELKKNYQNLKDITQVRIFRDIYNLIDSSNLVRIIYISLEKKFRLIMMHEVLSQAYAITVIAIAPCIMVLVYMFLAQFTKYWYMILGNVLISFILPTLSIKSYISSKANRMYLELAKAYGNFARHLVNNGKVEVAAERVINNSKGSVKRLFTMFRDEYLGDREQAYINFQNRVRDYYAEAFCSNLITYEDTGVDCSEILVSLSLMAVRNYKQTTGNYKDMLPFKIAGIITIAGSIALVKMVHGLALDMGFAGKDLTNTPAFYVIILVECGYLIATFLFSEG